MPRFFVGIITISILLCGSISAQEKNSGYQFTNLKVLPATPVKNQGSTSTCWVFSTLSMLESEMMKNGNSAIDLSEMFIVRHAYEEKAAKYVRTHGNISFTGGGEYNDVMNVIKKYGIVTAEVYKDKNDVPDHNELDGPLKKYVDKIAQTPEDKKLPPHWMDGVNVLLNKNLGEPPQKFNYSGSEFTPKSFAKYLGINPDDYVLFTSFTHHPFYEKFVLEVPDNWSWGEYYNVPVNELEMIIDTALYKNDAVTWAADVSEKGFSYSKGIAVTPDISGQDSSKVDWDKFLAKPCVETNVTQELRQAQFDNFATTDDHGMLIVGTAKAQNNAKFYYVKNSWGTDNPYKGYIYASESYVRFKTMSIMVNKNALPLQIRMKFKDLN